MRRMRPPQEGGYHSPEAFRRALSEVWWRPREFFRRLNPRGGPLSPALFAAGILYLNLLLSTVLQAIWFRQLDLSLLYTPLLGAVVAVVLGPAFVAGLSALALMVLSAESTRHKGFLPTFRALGYATGIGVVFWIPYAPLAALPYSMYVATVALRETHQLGWRHAMAAAVVPIVALLLIILIISGPSEAWHILINKP